MRSGKKRGVHARRGYHSGGAEGSLERGKERKKEERETTSLSKEGEAAVAVCVCVHASGRPPKRTHTRAHAHHTCPTVNPAPYRDRFKKGVCW